MKINELISENKKTIIFVILAMVIGSIVYFATGVANLNMQSSVSEANLWEDARFKVAFYSDGTMNVFTNIKNNEFLTLKAAEGNLIPEDTSMVIGSAQKAKMKSQGKFSSPGNHLTNYFGINTTIEGILVKTDSVIDDLQFLSKRQFEQVEGEEGRIFVKLEDKIPKMFFKLETNETTFPNFKFTEGNWSGYESHDLGGSMYYPLVIGAKEAKMMREKKIFTDTGDTIKDFFGKNFVVVGVLEETNTGVDRIYFVPLGEDELN